MNITLVKVGMGATIYGYSDRHAATVVAVSKSGKRITLQRDKATLLNGANSDAPDKLTFSTGGFVGHTSGEQRWQTEPDPTGSRSDYSLREVNGESRWVRVGETARGGERAIVGERNHHYDFNF